MVNPGRPDEAAELVKLRAQAQLSPIGVFHADAAGSCLFVNERWVELSGIPAAEALGRGWVKTVHPDARASLLATWEQAVRAGTLAQPLEVKHQRPDGRVWWALVQVGPIREGDRTTGYVGTLTDITELKQAQEALQAEKELSEQVISSSIDGILAFDRDVRYTLWNPVMETISGLPASEVVGRLAVEVFPFLEEIGEDRFFRGALRGEHLVARDRPFQVPSTGRGGFFEGHYAPLRDAHGEVVGGLGVIRDITERKRADDALADAQLQVVQSGKLAAMGQLGAGIAHELNQPLAGLKMLLSLIQRHPERPVKQVSRELELALEQVDRMARIVDNVRGFARKSEFTPQSTPALGALDDALMLMSEQLRLAGVEVVREVPSDLPPVLADPVRLQQVFLNLLSNALHALEELPPGAPRRLEVRVRRVRELIEYRFCDTGPGVPADARIRLFDPFFTTKETGQGTGLGLSLAYGIVQEHGGEIAHEVPPGGGACFVVRLPASVAPVPTTLPPDEPEVLAPHPARVLVVDDEPVMRQAVSNCLEHLGYRFETVDGAAAAEAALTEHDYDLALIDLRMPGVDGAELCERLHRSHPDLTLIAMSGFVTEEVLERLREAGVLEVLTKPFGIDTLAQTLGEAQLREHDATR